MAWQVSRRRRSKMEWRDVPGYPGYQVNQHGKLRKKTGYEPPMNGKRYALYRDGVRRAMTPAELIALAWPPAAPEPAQEAPAPAEPETPASPAAHAPAKTTGREIPEGFVPVPGSGGYRINRAGELINARGKRHRLDKRNYYALGHSKVSVSRLLYLTFGPGAATAAGYPEPEPLDTARQKRAAMQDYGAHCQRHCHDCGRPTNNYRCNACWALLRGSAAPVEESEWNAL